MDDGRLIDAGPKSRAGTRVVAFPREIVPELRWYLECFAQGEKDGGLVFVGPLGGRLRRSNFRRLWYKAREAVGLPEVHFHDLLLSDARKTGRRPNRSGTQRARGRRSAS